MAPLIIRRSARAMHDVPSLIAAADILTRASFEERFGLVYAEAMAMKKPVVAFDNDGTREVVDQEKCTLFLTQGDVPALAANLWRLAGGVARGYKQLFGQS